MSHHTFTNKEEYLKIYPLAQYFVPWLMDVTHLRNKQHFDSNMCGDL
jgi:hypothetical protein